MNSRFIYIVNFLKSHFLVSTISFHISSLQHIQKSLIDIVCVVQYSAANAQKPYDQVECRAALYETVETLCESKNVRLAPPISIVINLFKNALSDSSLQVNIYPPKKEGYNVFVVALVIIVVVSMIFLVYRAQILYLLVAISSSRI